ncbi:MAG: excinuclease ABC subunit UvrB, partial [Candidatus Thorarchaeota archaeon]
MINVDNMKFELISDYKPKGSQPEAINKLNEGIDKGNNFQTLLGVTGSGKTYTMANVIEHAQKPALVLAHNKTLAAQLYNEFQEFFPKNRVEYFVSYYDFYRPESYIPQKDQYIEKDADVNPKIEQMRLAATASLASRPDTIVVASVSCIFGLGNPKDYSELGFELSVGQQIPRKKLMEKLINIQYERNEMELKPGRFRVKGDTIDIVPAYFDDIFRIEMFGDEIEKIREVNKITGEVVEELKYYHIYPARHFVIPPDRLSKSIETIKQELEERLPQLGMIEAHRLKQRTLYDIEMIQEAGYCKGIENYSRHLDGRKPGEKPYTLLDYYPDDSLIFIDESHQTIPQLHGMYNGDFSRKKNLVEYGFRLESAFDNRPLKFDEVEKYLKKRQVIFVSATPADYELKNSTQVVEQVIRPTGLIDPEVIIRPITGQIEDLKNELKTTINRGDRVLITTLTKRLAEELTEFLADAGFKTRYLHSDIDTLERSDILEKLRRGEYDV